MRRRTTTPHTLRRGALAVAVAGLLAGCTGSGVSMSADESSAGGAGDAEVGTASVARAADGVGGAAKAGTAGRVGVQTRAVIATGHVTLVTDDLVRARTDLDRLVRQIGGGVAEERTSAGDGEQQGPASSLLVLRVPSPRFDEVMAGLDDVATVTETRREEVDVTTEVIDVGARIRTAEVSLQRLRGFLGRAGAVHSVIRLESEISEREADLASLRAQQDYLEDQTSLATITVTMRTPRASSEPGDPLDEAGFVSGLRDGWNALLDVLVVTATVAGALVPFAVVLGLVLVPVLVRLRSRRRTAAARPPVAPAA